MGTNSSKFDLGRAYITKGVNDLVAVNSPFAKFVMDSLRRHAEGDWGNVGKEDKLANERALIDGSRLVSAYETAGLPKVWVITEAVGDDGCRASTCILFPNEY
jgi:hypothetical protein